MTACLSKQDLTVLVVADEPTVRLVVSQVLKENGLTILRAGDGAEGLAHLEAANRIDLLVTDVGLPERSMDGSWPRPLYQDDRISECCL